jgi:hypothetical protein
MRYITLKFNPLESYFSADIVKENNQVITDHPKATPDFLALLTHPGILPHHL